jgi:hypothetical protein
MKEIAEKLKLKSPDAALRWCQNNKIDTQILANKRVINEFDFNLAFEQPVIDQLKQKYGNRWPDYYEIYKNGDIKKYYELENNKNIPVTKLNGFDADAFLKGISYGKS